VEGIRLDQRIYKIFGQKAIFGTEEKLDERKQITEKKSINIEGDILLERLRSDYYVAYAPNYVWEEAIQTMHLMIVNFNLDRYKPKNIIKTHWDEPLEWWDSEFETLYRNLKLK